MTAKYAKQKIKLVTDEAIDLLLGSVLVDLSEFDIQERANIFITAGELALIHENELVADDFIKKAWDVTIGYGSYKDYTINEVISSLGYLSEVDSEGAIDILKDLVPFISNFDSLTTEGSIPNDEINELLAKFSVGTLVSKYESELFCGEGSAAINTLNSFFKFADLSSPLLVDICKTGLFNDNLRALERRSNEGDDLAKGLLAIEHNGLMNVKEATERYSNSSNEKEVLEEQDFKAFPPERFLNFGKGDEKRFLYEEHYVAWFNYWISQGEQRELLANLVPLALEGHAHEVRNILDLLFDLSLQYRGKKHSFELLVAAHNQKQGWNTYYETDTALDRLNKVADIYPNCADEFVAKTTYNVEGSSLTLPYHRYTYLLCKLGRFQEAKDFSSSLAKQVIDETFIHNVKGTHWNWDAKQNSDLLLDLIISRLNVPIASIKWWVAKQLVNLLLDRRFTHQLENKLIEKLRKSEVELECINLLSIFYFASSLGDEPHKGISESVKSRSLCSDLIISKMGLNTDNCSYLFDPLSFTTFPNKTLRKAFESANGRDFPQIYLDSLEKLQQSARYPFPIELTEVMRSEWCNMHFNSESFDSNLSYYINVDGHSRDNTATFYPFSGLRARSAYLRALEFSKVNFGMPEAIHEKAANLAFPFDSCLFFLNPENIINCNKYEWSNEPTQIFDTLESLLSEIDATSKEMELGAVTFSIYIDELSCLEVEVIRSTCSTEEKIAEDDYPWLWRCQDSALDKEKVIINSSEKNTVSSLLAARSYPYQHFGHWHSEVDSRGVFCPVIIENEKKLVMRNADNCLEFVYGDDIIAEFKYANNNWQPSYNRNSTPNTISILMFDKKNRKTWSEPTKDEAYYCRIKVIKKKESYSDFEVFEYTRFIETSN